MGEWLTGCAEVQDAQCRENLGTRGVAWSSSLPLGQEGSQVRKFTNCGGKGRVLFLVLLLWVFLDELKCWKLTNKIYRISRILEQKGLKLTVFPLIKSRAHQRCFQVWTLAG